MPTKEHCTNCHADTMKQHRKLYLGYIEIWECPKCHLVDRYPRPKTPMSEEVKAKLRERRFASA